MIDLMDALKKSVAEAKKRKAPKEPAEKAPRAARRARRRRRSSVRLCSHSARVAAAPIAWSCASNRNLSILPW